MNTTEHVNIARSLLKQFPKESRGMIAARMLFTSNIAGIDASHAIAQAQGDPGPRPRAAPTKPAPGKPQPFDEVWLARWHTDLQKTRELLRDSAPDATDVEICNASIHAIIGKETLVRDGVLCRYVGEGRFVGFAD